jgi:DNA ligase-1
MLLGDIGAAATLASRKELHLAELSIFRPIKCMLATPEPTAEAVWKRFVEDKDSANVAVAAVYVEDKFDGIRAQLHRSTRRVEIFSRDLRRITDQFPELKSLPSKKVAASTSSICKSGSDGNAMARVYLRPQWLTCRSLLLSLIFFG